MDARFNMFDNEIAAKFGKRFANTSMVIGESSLPKATQELVSLRASQINGCGFCVDMHTKEAAAAGETAVRLNLVAAWREAIVFTEAERAALALAEEGTRLADSHLGVSDDTWAQVRKHYDDDQIAALVCLVALVNAANRMNVIVRNPAGSYEPGMFRATVQPLGAQQQHDGLQIHADDLPIAADPCRGRCSRTGRRARRSSPSSRWRPAGAPPSRRAQCRVRCSAPRRTRIAVRGTGVFRSGGYISNSRSSQGSPAARVRRRASSARASGPPVST